MNRRDHTATEGAVYRFEQPSVDGVCYGVDCAVGDAMLAAWLVFVGLFGLVTVAALLQLREAIDSCDREQTQVSRERTAFEQFAEAVAALQPESKRRSTPVDDGPTLLASGQSDGTSGEIVRLYRETVMSVPHYEHAYDEPLPAHMAAELGEDVTVAVCTGSGIGRTEQRALVSSARTASKRRKLLLDALDDELGMLERAKVTFDSTLACVRQQRSRLPLDTSFEDLHEDWRRLDEHHETCEQLLSERQERIHAGVSVPGQRWDGIEFYEYLYGRLAVTHPMLATGASILGDVTEQKRRLERAITRRV